MKQVGAQQFLGVPIKLPLISLQCSVAPLKRHNVGELELEVSGIMTCTQAKLYAFIYFMYLST